MIFILIVMIMLVHIMTNVKNNLRVNKMCDQANHDNCEIIDDLHLTITDLEMTIADLKAEIVEDLNELGDVINDGDEPYELVLIKKKWEKK